VLLSPFCNLLSISPKKTNIFPSLPCQANGFFQVVCISLIVYRHSWCKIKELQKRPYPLFPGEEPCLKNPYVTNGKEGRKYAKNIYRSLGFYFTPTQFTFRGLPVSFWIYILDH
jgi:hypothetical protein